MQILKCLLITALMALSVISIGAQTKKYSYAKQKQLIPVELGAVYLGMPFEKFAKQIDLSKAEVSNRFGWLEANMPYAKGNVESLSFKVYGLEEAEYNGLFKKVTTGRTTENGDNYEVEIQVLDTAKIPANKGIVYELSLGYKKGFDLKKHVTKVFGKPTDVHKKGVDYIYDMQWTKKTTDGLTWLIRYYESSNSIMLAGVIDDTEWDPGI